MSTFLAYTPPSTGHVYPLVPGLLELKRRGHRVILMTAEAHLTALHAAGLEAVPTDPAVDAVVVEDWTADSGQQQLKDALAGVMRRGPFERDDLERALARYTPDVVLVDTNAYGAAVAAEASGLRWGKTLPTVLPYPGRGIPPFGIGAPPMGGPLGRLRDAVGWRLVRSAYGKAMLPALNPLRASRGLPAFSDPLQPVLQSDRVLVLTDEPLEYPRTQVPQPVAFVGAQVWDPPQQEPDWLAAPGDPWVLVTCSTEYQGDEALALAAMEALRDLPVRVALTLGDAYDRMPVPEPTDRLRVERFLPHSAVLARACAVVCHAGMGIVNKSLAAGVPIVAVPFGRDQHEVARRVEQAGVGVRLASRGLAPSGLRAAVTEAIGLAPHVGRVAATIDLQDNAHRFATAAETLVRATGAARSRAGRDEAGGAPSLAQRRLPRVVQEVAKQGYSVVDGSLPAG